MIAQRPESAPVRANVESFSPGTVCVHELIEAQVRLTPHAIALKFHGTTLTYAELNERSNKFANYLRRLNVRAESLVGVCLERSPELWITLLGIMKAGSAYVPLDPAFPDERLAYMLEDSSAAVLVTGRTEARRFSTFSGTALVWEEAASRIDAESPADRPNGIQPDSLVYVIYTSGSTGKPKGVMIEHRAVVNLLRSMQLEPGATSEDSLLAVSTFSFDVAVLEMFLLLTVGGTVIVVDQETVIDARKMATVLSVERPTMMQATPAMWQMLIAGGWRGTRGLKALCGGESMSRDLAEQLLERADQVWNLYGPTETTIWSLVYQVCSGPGKVPIGRPIANTQVYVLDSEKQPVSRGTMGTLYIGGDGLARGYQNRPDLTREKFITTPFVQSGGERLYDTGDLARYRPDGLLEWHGRLDSQVKIQGYRIELEEIETVLRQLQAVRNAVVAARAKAANSEEDQFLVAYIVPEGQETLSLREVRRHCEKFLPVYMLPSAVVLLGKLPLTPNGKLDRSALPAPAPPLSESNGEAPRNPLEQQLLRFFEALLIARPIGVTDSFFELGGNSLLAAQLIMRIERETGHAIPTATLFQAPTVQQLALKLDDRTYTDAWSSIVELRKGGPTSAEPLFCIHWLDAKLVTFFKIASLLSEDRAVFGLQPGNLDGEKNTPHTIHDVAAVYLREIRNRQPKGPYYLTGSCLGGVVAFEIAQQLIAEGERVNMLLMIDAYMPGPLQYLHERPFAVERFDWYLGEFLLSPRAALTRWFQESVTRLSGKAGRDNSLSRASKYLRQVTVQAEANYRPQSYPGKITLLICGDGPFRAYEDRRLAWSSVADGGLEVHVIPGNHSTMEQEPNVRELGERFQRCFDRLNSEPTFPRTAD